MPSGLVIRRHGHRSPHVICAMEGDLLAGDAACEAGSRIELPDWLEVRRSRWNAR